VSFNNPVLWDVKSQELYSLEYDQLADATKENKVKEDAKQAFLAYLFFINSNDKKHSQLKNTVANDHMKGDTEAFPSSCHAALTLMNDFKPLVIRVLLQWQLRVQHLSRRNRVPGLWEQMPVRSVTITRNTSRTR
jgi:hypothetical protein